MDCVEGPVVRQEGEGVDDGGEGLHRGGALRGGGGLHHQRLRGQGELPQRVEVLQQRRDHQEQLRGGRGHGGHGRGPRPRVGDGLLDGGLVRGGGEVQLQQGAEHGQREVGAGAGGGPARHVVTRDLHGHVARLEILPGHDVGEVGVEADQGEVGQEDDGLLVVAAADAGILHLAEVGEPKQKVVVHLQGGQTLGVVDSVVQAQRVGGEAGPRPPDAEVELDIAHDAGVGVGEGEVADVGLVLLGEGVRVGRGGPRVDALYNLAQLEVECDYSDAVQPAVQRATTLAHCYKLSTRCTRTMKISIERLITFLFTSRTFLHSSE